MIANCGVRIANWWRSGDHRPICVAILPPTHPQSTIRNSKSPSALLLLLFLTTPYPVLSQSPDWSRVHSLTVDGIDRLYNLDAEGADRRFDEVIRIAPNDLRGWFFKSMVQFYLYQLTMDSKAYARFFELSEQVIERGDAVLDRNSADKTAQFYLGGTYGYRGLAYMRNGSTLSAIWEGRKGYSMLKEAATGENYSVDARMGFGLFSYLIAKIPSAYSWVLGVIGYTGDLDGGLAMIRTAADSGIYTRTEAAFYYAQFCFFEERFDDAYSYLHRIIDQYPANSLFLVTLATWELRRNHIDSAIAIGQRAIAVNERSQVRIGGEFVHSTLAAAFYARNDFRAAIAHWDEYIALTENKESISNYVYYRLGISHELLGDRARALDSWGRMKPSTDGDKPYESVFWRRVQRFLVAPMQTADVTLVVAGNHAQAGRHVEAAELYRVALRESGADRERRALALYGLLTELRECGDDEEVLSIAPAIMQTQPKQELWTIPHALYRLGQAYATLRRPAEARQAYEQALAYEDYDWEPSHRGRLEKALKALEERPEGERAKR